MKTHTSQFKEDIKTVGKQLDSKITFKVNGVAQTLTSEDLNGVTPTFQGAILKSVMKELDIDSNVNIPIGTEVNYQFGVKLENNFEYLDYGNYIVYSSEKQEDTSSYKIICYDKMLYSMKQNEDLGITYPISIRNYINALCTKIGLEFKNKNDKFANFDRVLDKELYVGLDYTYRDILDELAQVTASTICLDSEDKVEIRYINDLTELNEVVGTNISINDSIDYKLNLLTLHGRSTQATRSGKNLLNPNGASRNGSGLTFTNNGDGSFTVEGTSTANVSLVLSTQKIKLNANQPYTQSITTVSGTKTGEVVVSVKNSSDKITFNYIAGNQTITPTEDLTTHTYTYYVETGKTVNWTFKVQLEEGSTATDYEQYGVSPSPDFPSPIESIGRKNLFDVTLDSSVTNDIQYKTYRLAPNTKYTISTNTYLSNKVVANIFIDLGTSLTPSSSANGVNGSKVITTDSTGYVTIGYRNYSMQLDYSTGMYYCQLEKGTVATDYVPYEHTEISATVTGKNLFDRANAYVNFALNWGTGKNFGESGSVASLFIPTKVGDKFTINYSSQIMYYDKNKDYLGCLQSGGTTIAKTTGGLYKYFTTPNVEEICYMRLGVRKISDGGEDKTDKDIMLNREYVLEPYEPYKESSITINLQGNELCSLPNGTKDEVNITNGEALLIKRVGKVVLDGSNDEVWIMGADTFNNFHFFTTNKITDFKKGKPNTPLNIFVSDKFHFVKSSGVADLGGSYFINNLFLVFSNIETVNEFKTWLSTHNVEVLYELEEPETVNLGTVEMLHTYNGVSNITNSADTEMVVKYSKGWETINEEYLKDINVNFGQKYGPVNSVVLTRGAESDNIYLQDENSIAQNGLCEIKIADNQIMNWNDRSDYLPDILEKLDGLEYYLNDFSSTGIAYLDLCDRYNIEVFENTYSCVMFNDELLVTQGLEENVHTDMPEETETDYTKADKTDKKIKQAYIIVDKQNQTINSVVQDIGALSDTINSQGEQIEALGTRITQTTDNITATVTSIQDTLDNGVNLVKTTAVIVDNSGLTVATDTSKTTTKMTSDKFAVTSGGVDLAFFGYDETEGRSKAEMDNLTVKNYLTAGYHRQEKFEPDGEKRTGWFYVGGDI